jgi:indolepyruvate ferredoxin oxidoreductase alpha subunit
MPELLTGNEALARGAYEAGVTYASAYPGTPSTEILETLATHRDVIAEWAPNEKVSLECAIGASLAGARALSAMKMVGVNVAADPLFSFSYSGVTGGLVLVSADDPGQHSSQNEQDNRYYAPFAKVPMLEPSDSQESKDMAVAAFEISETYDVPVLFRTTTRVCHSKSLVTLGTRTVPPRRPYARNVPKYVLVPGNARQLRAKLGAKVKRLADYSETTPFNFVEWNGPKIGIITSGMGYQHAREVFGNEASYLKLGFTWPLPAEKIRKFAARVETLYVVEEIEPYLEDEIRRLGISCIGKDKIPTVSELDPAIVGAVLKGIQPATQEPIPVLPRPPLLCAGCPHRGFFVELGKIARKRHAMLPGDIGCYALGAAPPLDAQETCICMGSAPSIAHGAQKVFSKFGEPTRVVATLGDSTFFHTGMNSVLNLVYNKSNAIVCVLDNRITGMTGQQDHPGTGVTLQGEATTEIDIATVCRAFGLANVRTINPNNLREVRETLKWAFDLEGPSVIVTKWPCRLKKLNAGDRARYAHRYRHLAVREDRCNGCRSCLKIGCPAILFDTAKEKARVDANTCVGCEVCAQVCGSDAFMDGELEHA